ncbi:DUF3383 family protein [Aurantimonas coralicida]|uniref:DUF3383 family protein n=1 Tax=Aurantimonas coralicida TaxID=182270 RepID=UPI001E363611|nr:DUF3383 family protein [Aurantimonas coralicida]MCD1645249.1 DUF3383 domain-containing protein [Aurantimonas coralicida]
MAQVPYSRVVNVSLTRSDAFPQTRGFGVAMLLTSTTVAGKLDASNLTRVYGSIEEVAVDFDDTDAFYIAALAAFSQNPRPLQVKAGWYNATAYSGALDAAAKGVVLSDALDAIQDADPNWYWMDVEASLRDEAALDDVVAWIEAHRKQAIITSNDANLKDESDETNIAARHKGTVERTSIFYHETAGLYPGFALAALLGTRNFDNSNSAYTAKFKKLQGITASNIGSAAIQAITGFVPALGQDTTSGHCANAYIDIGDRDFTVEGSTLTPNVFIDEVHATDWIVTRTEEQSLGVFLNNARVPYDDEGMEMLASAPRTVMGLANRAGLIANDQDPNGEYAPNYTITVPSVFDVPASQRKARISPNIPVTFRYAGAVHFTTINYTMTF